MKTHSELIAYQATLDPIRDYFPIMERPVGSFTWTFAKIATDEKSANQKAIDIAMTGTCTRIIRGQLPRMPDETFNYATLADGDTQFNITPSDP